MKTEELVQKIGLAMVAAGNALLGNEVVATTTTPEAVTETKTATEKKTTGRKRKTKAEKEAEKKEKEAAEVKAQEETQVETVSEDDFGGDETPEPNVEMEITEDILKKELVRYAKEKGKDQAFKHLAKFKTKKVADLTPEQRVAVYNEIAVNA